MNRRTPPVAHESTPQMIALRVALCAGTILASIAAFGQTRCGADESSLSSLLPPRAIELADQRFKAGDYGCAVHIVRLQVQALAAAPGRDGIDARFALRELALSLLDEKSHPSAARLELLKASAGTLDIGKPDAPRGEMKADVRTLVAGAKRFRDQRDFASWLDALEAAIRIDRRQPDDYRALQSWEMSTDPFSEAARSKEFSRLANLASISRGDKVLAGLRSGLAHAVYYSASAWKDSDKPEVIAARCRELLRLTELLSDVSECYGCGKEWRWKPIMTVGVAYHRLGMQNEAKSAIEESLRVVRGVENPDYRLGQLRFVLTDLLAAKYDRGVIHSVASDMKKLSDSIDTPVAKEVRKSLPETMKRWGFGEFQ